MYKKFLLLFTALLIIAGLFACNTAPAETALPASQASEAPAVLVATEAPTPTLAGPTETAGTAAITVTDFRDKEITLDKPVARIACVLPNVLNNLYMLGLTKEIVGVHQWSLKTENPDFPFITQIDPRLKTGELQALNGNVELIVSLKPDIAILQASDEIIPTLEENGVKVYGVQVADFDGVTKLMQDLGKITGKEARAQEIIDYTNGKIQSVQEKLGTVSEDQKPTGLFVWGPSTLDIAGSTSTGQAILSDAGGKNAAADIKDEHIVAKMEDVVNWNPDVVVLWYSDKLKVDDFLNDPGWQTISAVTKKQVYMLPNGFYTDLWTPKYQFSILATAKWMYPDLFANVNLEDEQKQMIKELYQFDFQY